MIDEDAPDDPESVMFWCKDKASVAETQSVSQTASMSMEGEVNPNFITDITAGLGTPSATSLPSFSGAPGTDALLATSKSLLEAGQGPP